MGVRTEADEALDGARESVQDAVHKLASIVIHQCPGHKDFSEPYQLKIRKALQDLIQIREDLD
jgi:hypothetical protein